ncbi:bacillithiol biosynthesis cysteine-adding enzyme BshC [Alkalihalobacterium alkalinitrilicum]|uniref:bacillithiol biosynthesis cysteine-adding enzyme BshC n=1 Tax=Alkalihalobacterium alkalinitrilicum TaxID=427920 RepID=UPI0013033349|nr:bacillithiol biosynthesis cysteine-adding enzyme BshC [Alkalihalobacterium alkalinitrilicum]
MNVKEVELSPTTKIAKAYIEEDPQIHSFFEYDYLERSTYASRYEYIKNRTYDRDLLADALITYNEKLIYHEKNLLQIERLRDPNSVVVVTGQQPGLMTGPLYTIYKALTVIVLAKEQERQLGVPVIPVFWVAGEDHDFLEVNHLFLQGKNQLVKYQLFDRTDDVKSPLSERPLAYEKTKNWIEDVFASMPETNYTKELLEVVTSSLKNSTSYSHFFSQLMAWFFKEEGLVLLDAADVNIRSIEKPMFLSLIEESYAIQKSFLTQSEQLEQFGFGTPIDRNEENANLFIIENGQRHRLDRISETTFVANQKIYSKQELLSIAQMTPERLSNNVVTRPIMQEFLLPVLAFVGGPGEIAYWSTLKKVFKSLEMKMPPIVPRLSITLLEKKHSEWLEKKGIMINEALSNPLSKMRDEWYEKQKKWDIEKVATDVKLQIENVHNPLRQIAGQLDETSEKLANKNIQILLDQIDVLYQKLERQQKEKYKYEFMKYDAVEQMVFPNQKPQERIYNIFQFINQFGFELIDQVKAQEINVNRYHKIIEL